MSATLETNNVSGSWKKRQRENSESAPLDLKELKRPRLYYFRLASESSRCSEDDTESVCSIQDRSTDIVRDTSDTDSRAGDLSEYEVEIEYEVASSSDGDGARSTVSSTDSEGMVLSAAAAFIIDTSLEAWITDVEDSDDNSTSDETSFGRTDFWQCVQCNGRNDNPLYRYCEKCFQARKRFFPPRPRRNKRARNKQEKKNNKEKIPVKLDLLRNCLSGLSQDSGIGSSQECPLLDLDQIVVPDASTKSGKDNNSEVTSISLDKRDKETSNDKDKSNSSVVKLPLKPTSSSVSEVNHGLDIKDDPNVAYDSVQTNEAKTSPLDKENNSGIVKTEDESNKAPKRPQNSVQTRASKRLRKHSSENLFEESDDIKQTSTPDLTSKKAKTYLNLDHVNTRRKRTFSESSLSDFDDAKKPRLPSRAENAVENLSHNSTGGLSLSQNSAGSSVEPLSQGSISSQSESELCLFCNNAPKDSIFLHTNIAHRCCCYRCAKKTLKTTKRCPICNRSVNKVLKIFTS